ncbi:monooxygenase 2-like [Salvia miltiorrhiza]|uniref:monooxygenase 2-like n=1 Tax=Salvia miltiorrhiza TaxID=226208 RepID=UPI0025ACE55C|nr:monooxygenase 2-like [Salvia miltiorrhiza]
MEPTIHEQDMLIVGGGIAGLTTALGLHRLGIRSLVLEASDGLRTTGFALTIWTNVWIALDTVGIGDAMRANSLPIEGYSQLQFLLYQVVSIHFLINLLV